MIDDPAGGPKGPGGGELQFGRRMTGAETLMWRLGGEDPRLVATMSLVVGLAGAPDVEAIRGRIEALCAAVPRLRQRVREPAWRLLAPSWETDPGFGLDRHFAVTDGPVWEVAARVVAEPFAHDSPPWRAVLVRPAPPPGPRSPAVPGNGTDGTEAGAAVVLHLHHSYTDGLGGIRLLGELLDVEDGPRRGGPNPVGSEPTEPPRAPDLLGDVRDEVMRVAAMWNRAVPWARATLGAAHRDPARFLASAKDLLAEVQVHAAAAMGPPSPELAPRSAGVHLSPLHLALDDLRGAGRRLGATVNDLFVSGLLDGLARYHAKEGPVPPSLRLGLPISVRNSDAGMHNQLLGAVVRGPLGSLDFDERTRLVHEMLLHARHQPWAGALDDLAAGAARLPGAVGIAAAAVSSLDVLASNLPGPPVPLWLAGTPVSSMTPFGPRTGAALNATLLSYAGTAAIGLNADPAAVRQPELLSDCVAAAFADALG